MSDPDQLISKVKLPVELEQDDGTVLMGFIFVAPQGRLSDVLNDARPFLPFETSNGKFCVFRKSALLSVTPLNQEHEVYDGNDPFRLLGVDEDTSISELKKVYFKLCIDQHPDKLKGMGLNEEFIELANIRMARINEAFQRAVKIKTFADAEAAKERAEAET